MNYESKFSYMHIYKNNCYTFVYLFGHYDTCLDYLQTKLFLAVALG